MRGIALGVSGHLHVCARAVDLAKKQGLFRFVFFFFFFMSVNLLVVGG